jgi:hypothetical protein
VDARQRGAKRWLVDVRADVGDAGRRSQRWRSPAHRYGRPASADLCAVEQVAAREQQYLRQFCWRRGVNAIQRSSCSPSS